jgi:hypothetical protein
MTEGRFPNLFLVGAPKCGTTALHGWLSTHPDVFMGRKEAHFFGSDEIWRFGSRRTLDQYVEFFAAATTQRYVGDACSWYLYSPVSAREIAAMAPDARFLVMLRNPVDQMHAQHSQQMRNGAEDIADFAAALDAELDRRAGHRIPPTCGFPRRLLYREIVDFAEQLTRYFDVFGRDRVHVVRCDDVTRDPGAAYRQVLEFLDIDPDHRPQFDVVNPNRRARSLRAAAFFARPPAVARAVAGALIPHEGARKVVRRRIRNLNLVVEPRPPIDPALRSRLQRELAPKVRALEELLGWDLRAWREPNEAARR